ncbi:MAG: glycosyltransferase [Elusimicrobiales bacterium]
MQKKIAILYAREPSGHVSAARAVQESLAARGAQAVRVNLSHDLYRLPGRLTGALYVEMLRYTPFVWELLYDDALVRAFAIPVKKLFFHKSARKLSALLAEHGFDAAVCTHSLPCFVLSRARMDIPVFAVLTDFSAHHFWPEKGVAGYFVHEESARRDLISRGIAPERVAATGIPVRGAYLNAPPRQHALHQLDLDPSLPCALLCGGSKGLGHMEEGLAALGRVPGLQIIASCGANEPLRKKLSDAARGARHIRVLGETDTLDAAMGAADFIAGKTGGITCSEALAMGKPLLIFAPLPGQEARNARFLISRGAAFHAANAAQLRDVAEKLTRDAAYRGGILPAMSALARPRAADEIAETVLSSLCA